MSKPVRIWDIPTRLFHWVLVLLIVNSYVTQWQSWMDLHILCGEAILALLLFRVVWGVVGSDTARFGFFLKSPIAAFHHLLHLRKREPDTEIGHNAAGGWMVIGMLALLFAQVGTGLFTADDDALVEGPLRHLVSKETSDLLGMLHDKIFDAIKIVVILHIAAIVVYLVVKGHNLVRPMVIGTKDIAEPVTKPRFRSPVLAAVILVIAAAAVAALVRL